MIKPGGVGREAVFLCEVLERRIVERPHLPEIEPARLDRSLLANRIRIEDDRGIRIRDVRPLGDYDSLLRRATTCNEKKRGENYEPCVTKHKSQLAC